MNKSASRWVGSVAFAAILVGSAMAQGAGSNQMQAKGSYQALTHMSNEAASIFADVTKASNALAGGNNAAARQDIQMAMQVRNRLAMTARSNNLPKVVPLFTETEQSTDIGTLLAQKNNGKALPAARRPVTVDDVNDQFTFVGVDLDKTKARLEAANQALHANNVQAAKDTLNAVGEDLVVVKIGVDAPLLAIRENLGVAQLAVTDHRPNEATAALQQASTELKAYAQSGGSSHEQDAANLQKNIDTMLSTASQKGPSASSKIGGWWVQVNSWMQMPSASAA